MASLYSTSRGSFEEHRDGSGAGGTARQPAGERRHSRLRLPVVAVALALLATALAVLETDQAAGPRGHQSLPRAQLPLSAPTPRTSPSRPGTARHVPLQAPGWGIAGGVGIGVYAGPGDVAGAYALQDYLGLPVRYAMDFFSNASWASITQPTWVLGRWAGSGFTRIWGVPMLPGSGATLQAGARGAYDSYFAALARLLVQSNQSTALLVLGWDADLPGLPWSATTPTEAAWYVAYWRHIVSAMRAVPGARFQFVWDAAQTSTGIGPKAIYPGNAYVDIIATDVLQQELAAGASPGQGPPAATTVTPQQQWAMLLNVSYGLEWFAELAALHSKPLAIDKWGLAPQGAGPAGSDDPYFVTHLLAWMTAHSVLYGVIWDYGTWSITSGAFPLSAAALRHTLRSEERGSASSH